MILIGLGSNLLAENGDSPEENCRNALKKMANSAVSVVACSRFYKTAPVPASDQPWFINAVAAVETDLAPEALLDCLLSIEADMGRKRGERNAARIVDLDLLAYHDTILAGDRLTLPHPRLVERAFVLIPLADIASDWVHPVTKQPLKTLISALNPAQKIELLD